MNSQRLLEMSTLMTRRSSLPSAAKAKMSLTLRLRKSSMGKRVRHLVRTSSCRDTTMTSTIPATRSKKISDRRISQPPRCLISSSDRVSLVNRRHPTMYLGPSKSICWLKGKRKLSQTLKLSKRATPLSTAPTRIHSILSMVLRICSQSRWACREWISITSRPPNWADITSSIQIGYLHICLRPMQKEGLSLICRMEKYPTNRWISGPTLRSLPPTRLSSYLSTSTTTQVPTYNKTPHSLHRSMQSSSKEIRVCSWTDCLK